MLIIGAVKLIGQLAVGAGVSTVTKLFIKSITPSNVTKYTKVVTDIGGWFIGGVLCMQAGKKLNGDIDRAVKFVKRITTVKKEQESIETKTEIEAE